MPGKSDPVTVVGIDTSLRSAGIGVITQSGMRQQARHFEVVKNPQRWSHGKCLRHIHERVTWVIKEYEPEAIAIEGIFYCKNFKVAFALGEARGAAMTAAAQADVPVYEYAPRSVKKGVVGSGRAHKEQVGHMVKMILGLKEVPPDDAADALAIAMCHLQHSRVEGLREV